MPRKTRQPARAAPVWYEGGLQFECTRCRACCGGAPGYVWVTRAEIDNMAGLLAVSPEEFARAHCRRVFWRISLKERADGDCVLLGPEGCTVYPARPSQCRTFPFWPDYLRSRSAWREVQDRCPGVGRGRLYSRDEVDKIVDEEGRT